MLGLNNFLPTNGFSIKPLKVKLLAGEQKATEACLFCIGALNFEFVGLKQGGFSGLDNEKAGCSFWERGLASN